jgi:protein-S-isoprenylcysteine O-methyltransferase Ste14
VVLRAFIAFLALPGVFGFLLPLLIASIDPFRSKGLTSGYVVLAAGAIILLWCVRDFFVSGKGTLAPWDPPKHLVVAGLYCHVRNPMYVGVLVLVMGWALAAGSPAAAIYDVLLAVGFHIRVVTREEPWLSRQFTTQWTGYAAAVPRWRPRIKPWKNTA